MITIKGMKSVMERCYQNEDMESYDEIWKAIQVLHNVGLLEKNFVDAMVKEDHKLFEDSNK